MVWRRGRRVAAVAAAVVLAGGLGATGVVGAVTGERPSAPAVGTVQAGFGDPAVAQAEAEVNGWRNPAGFKEGDVFGRTEKGPDGRCTEPPDGVHVILNPPEGMEMRASIEQDPETCEFSVAKIESAPSGTWKDEELPEPREGYPSGLVVPSEPARHGTN